MASVQTEQPDLVLRVEESITIDIENHIKPHDGQDITPPVYSIFSTQKKRWITFLVAFGGWFSTLSSFIYFPAITALADSLQTSITKVNLTVTAYLVVSAIAPAIAGDLADMSGRRPVIVGMLGIYVVANVGLAVQRSYSALLILRMVQSAGISGETSKSKSLRL
jgi:MFS family permease